MPTPALDPNTLIQLLYQSQERDRQFALDERRLKMEEGRQNAALGTYNLQLDESKLKLKRAQDMDKIIDEIVAIQLAMADEGRRKATGGAGPDASPILATQGEDLATRLRGSLATGGLDYSQFAAAHPAVSNETLAQGGLASSNATLAPRDKANFALGLLGLTENARQHDDTFGLQRDMAGVSVIEKLTQMFPDTTLDDITRAVNGDPKSFSDFLVKGIGKDHRTTGYLNNALQVGQLMLGKYGIDARTFSEMNQVAGQLQGAGVAASSALAVERLKSSVEIIKNTTALLDSVGKNAETLNKEVPESMPGVLTTLHDALQMADDAMATLTGDQPHLLTIPDRTGFLFGLIGGGPSRITTPRPGAGLNPQDLLGQLPPGATFQDMLNFDFEVPQGPQPGLAPGSFLGDTFSPSTGGAPTFAQPDSPYPESPTGAAAFSGGPGLNMVSPPPPPTSFLDMLVQGNRLDSMATPAPPPAMLPSPMGRAASSLAGAVADPASMGRAALTAAAGGTMGRMVAAPAAALSWLTSPRAAAPFSPENLLAQVQVVFPDAPPAEAKQLVDKIIALPPADRQRAIAELMQRASRISTGAGRAQAP